MSAFGPFRVKEAGVSEVIGNHAGVSKMKMLPCPKCKSDEALAVYSYDSGWRHVECVKCNYLGPGEGSIRAAIKSHNDAIRSAKP